MKRILFFTFSIVAFLTQINAQNNITLNINHKLGDIDFEMNMATKNNLKHDFNVTRLEYYISEISIVHDSGQETKIEDLWVLADATNKTEIELGVYDISTVEKIKFHIGVDQDHNHLDPSSYDSDHPLAPKSPSMHWGWTPGYRFVAIEGYGGSSFNQLFQLHGLGDSNYFTTEIELTAIAENNQININLDGDYSRALEDLQVNSGLISHSEFNEAKKCVENFRDFVFSPSSISSNAIDLSEIIAFNTFPNPTTNGSFTIKLDVKNNTKNYDLSITSIDGRNLSFVKEISSGGQIDISYLSAGLYFVNLITEGNTILTHKIIVE